MTISRGTPARKNSMAKEAEVDELDTKGTAARPEGGPEVRTESGQENGTEVRHEELMRAAQTRLDDLTKEREEAREEMRGLFSALGKFSLALAAGLIGTAATEDGWRIAATIWCIVSGLAAVSMILGISGEIGPYLHNRRANEAAAAGEKGRLAALREVLEPGRREENARVTELKDQLRAAESKSRGLERRLQTARSKLAGIAREAGEPC